MTTPVTRPPAGPATTPLDPRRHAYREDLADGLLWDKVQAANYSDGAPRTVMWPVLPVRRAPDVARGFETEALFGETVRVFEERDGWAWVQLDADRYVGYVPAAALAEPVAAATHRVHTLGTFIYPEPNIKSPPLAALSLGSRVAVQPADDRFSKLATGGYVITRHLSEFGKPARDFVAVAERFLGTPYLWGGRSRLGLDCSGLAQLAMEAAGLVCPRDSDMQQAEVGADVLVPQDLEGLRRGDLVFWSGHVGIMSDGVMMVHANGHHMATVTEPLVSAARRIARTGSNVTAIKRLDALSANPSAPTDPLD